jgi:hypothetical protein
MYVLVGGGDHSDELCLWGEGSTSSQLPLSPRAHAIVSVIGQFYVHLAFSERNLISVLPRRKNKRNKEQRGNLGSISSPYNLHFVRRSNFPGIVAHKNRVRPAQPVAWEIGLPALTSLLSSVLSIPCEPCSRPNPSTRTPRQTTRRDPQLWRRRRSTWRRRGLTAPCGS